MQSRAESHCKATTLTCVSVETGETKVQLRLRRKATLRSLKGDQSLNKGCSAMLQGDDVAFFASSDFREKKKVHLKTERGNYKTKGLGLRKEEV